MKLVQRNVVRAIGLGGVSLAALMLDVIAVHAQSALPPVTVDAPQAPRARGAVTASRPSASRAVRVNRAARRTPVAPPAAIASTTERANGPVNGYVATRTATSTKTDTPIIETPQTISVVSREQIRDQGGQTLGDVLNYVPGVSTFSSSYSRVSDNVAIRGFDVAAGNSGLLRDGLKLTSGVYDSTTEPFGLERLEVVKGASSILFGQLGPGGLVNAISKKPTDVPFGEINASLGTYQRKEISGDVSGPLTKDGTLSYRLTGLLRDGDAPTRLTPDDKFYVAPAVTWRPDANTSLTVLGYYQKFSTRFPAPLPTVGTVVPTVAGRIPSQQFLGEPTYDRYESQSGAIGYQFEHAFNNALKLRQNLRYYEAETQWDYLPISGLSANGQNASRSVSNRIDKGVGFAVDTSVEAKFITGPFGHTAIAGIDYYRSVLDQNRFSGTASPINVYNPIYGTPVNVNRTANAGSNAASDQVGLYLQDQIKLGDKLVILLGGRKDYSEVKTTPFSNNRTTTQNDDAWTGRAGAVFLTDIGLAPFASFSQSFAPILGTDRLGAAFQPTRGQQFEAGVRYQPFGSRTLLSAAAFAITQQNVLTPDPVNVTFNVQNGEVQSRGIELEAKTEYGPVSLVSSYTYTDARTTKSNNPAILNDRVALAPFNTASVWGLYDFGAIGWHGFRFGGGVRYVGDANIPGSIYDVPSYVVADLAATYDFGQLSRELIGFQARLNVKNLFNKGYVICVANNGCRYGDPQTVLATLTYRW